jgi:hypothetical protein
VDVDEFYAANPRRGTSPEVRFGGHWLDEAGYVYAVAWVENTGELYALRQVEHEGGPPPFADPWVHLLRRRDGVEVEIFVLLTEPSRARVDSLLEGWADLQGRPGGFEDLVTRLDDVGYPPPW